MRPALKSRALRKPALCALMSFAVGISPGFAAPVYWGQTAHSSGSTYEGTVATTENWFTDPLGTQVASIAPNSPDDDLVFNTTPANTAGGNVTIDTNFSANSFTFNTSGSTVLAQDANRSVILGTGGITLSSTSGNVTFGINVNTLSVRLAASQTWTNASASTLTVRNVSTQATTGPVTLSLNASGSGNILLPLSVTDTLDDPLSIVIDSAGSGVVTMAAGAHSGGTTINRGKLSISGGKIARGEIALGSTTGAFDATLTVNSVDFPSNLTVPSGSSGKKTLITTNPAGVLKGTLTLNDTLTLTGAGKLTTLTGAISGTGALVKNGKGALTLAGPSTFSGNLSVDDGTLSLAESGSLSFAIGTNGVTDQVNGASSGAVTFSGTFTFMISGTSLVDGNSWPIVTVATKSFGPTFAITGFTQKDDVWTNGAGLTFSESTGVLSYKRTP